MCEMYVSEYRAIYYTLFTGSVLNHLRRDVVFIDYIGYSLHVYW